MSLGPEKVEKMGVSITDKIIGSIKKASENYLSDVFHCSFSIMLPLTILGLFSGMKFSWQFYVLLIILFGIEIYYKKEEVVYINDPIIKK